MASRPARLRILSLMLACLIGTPSVVAAQDEPTVDEQALESCDAIKEAIKQYQPLRIETAVRRLDGLYREVSPKTLKKVDKALLSVLTMKPRRPEVDGEDTRGELVEAYLLTIGLLYDEEHGPDLFQKALKQPHVKDWRDVKAAMVEGLGYRKDPKLLRQLYGFLEDEDGVVAGAAARALAQYSEAPQDDRERIVATILEVWEEVAEEADKEQRRGKKSTAHRTRLDDIEGPFGLSLVQLTRQDLPDLAAWRRWFDEHGGDADW